MHRATQIIRVSARLGRSQEKPSVGYLPAHLDKLHQALHGLVLDPGWNITSHTLRSWKDEPCVRTATCNGIERKLPAVPAEPSPIFVSDW